MTVKIRKGEVDPRTDDISRDEYRSGGPKEFTSIYNCIRFGFISVNEVRWI